MTPTPEKLAKRGPEHQEDGYRDRYCVICGAGPAVHLIAHYRHTHGVGYRDLGLALADVMSDDHRAYRAALAEDHRLPEHNPNFDPSGRRRRRWAAAVTEEFSRGPGWTTRLARRWRVSAKTARHRVETLREAGFLPASTRGRAPAVCGTAGGANRHRRRGEPCCAACRAAEVARRRQRWAENSDAINARRRQRWAENSDAINARQRRYRAERRQEAAR